jgi:hypothetical protein
LIGYRFMESTLITKWPNIHFQRFQLNTVPIRNIF